MTDRIHRLEVAGMRADPDFDWAELGDAKLFQMRLCDLGVRLEDCCVADRVAQVQDELAACGLRLRPHFWLSEEWFSPEGVPGLAIPFHCHAGRRPRCLRRACSRPSH